MKKNRLGEMLNDKMIQFMREKLDGEGWDRWNAGLQPAGASVPGKQQNRRMVNTEPVL